MYKKKRWAMALLVLLVAGVILTGCQGQGSGAAASSQKKVTIGYLPITHALPVFEEKELLEAAGGDVQIELQKFSSWTDLMDALNAGKIDGASVLIELAMGAVNKGIDLKAVALGHRDGNVLVVSDAVTTPQDLKGKTIAIPSTQSSHNILVQEALAKAGLSAKDVKLTELSPTEMPSSLASGAIDGYCVAEPFGAAGVVKGFGHVLYESGDLWENSVCCAFVLNGAFIKNNPEVAQVVIDSYQEAGQKLDEATATTVAEKYLGQDAAVLKESLKWISYDNLTLTREDYGALSEKVKADGINTNPPSYDDFVYSQN